MGGPGRGSGGEVHGAELVEDAGECRGPWPSGGEVECVAAGGVGHATGRGNKFAADRGTGDELSLAAPDDDCPAGQVVSEGREAQPCGVGVEPSDGQWARPLSFKSRIASSTTAWARWWRSSSRRYPVRFVTNA